MINSPAQSSVQRFPEALSEPAAQCFHSDLLTQFGSLDNVSTDMPVTIHLINKGHSRMQNGM